MSKNLTIRSFSGFLLLIVFTFGITPKRYLHDLFAAHIEVVSSIKYDGNEHIAKRGFQCDCNTLVATSPFTDSLDDISISAFTTYKSFLPLFHTRLYSQVHSFFELRGPPMLG